MIWIALPLIVLAVGFTLLPILRSSRRADVSHLSSDLEVDPVLERKDVVLTNILDLEFEHRMGKLSDDDYLAARREMEEEAATLLDRLETENIEAGELEQRIDAEVARQAAQSQKNGGQRREKRAMRVCPNCRASNPVENRFCGSCGAALEMAS